MWGRRSHSLLGLPGKTMGVDGRSPGRALEQEGERAHAGGQGPTVGTPGRRIAAAAEGASQAGWRRCCRGVSGARGAQTRWQLRHRWPGRASSFHGLAGERPHDRG